MSQLQSDFSALCNYLKGVKNQQERALLQVILTLLYTKSEYKVI